MSVSKILKEGITYYLLIIILVPNCAAYSRPQPAGRYSDLDEPKNTKPDGVHQSQKTKTQENSPLNRYSRKLKVQVGGCPKLMQPSGFRSLRREVSGRSIPQWEEEQPPPG
ncbi:hypothetical protein BJX61DRAFT_218353 [Aspergillus egyptiacus]|nr:hypothetical protein BJX61DRAFT_218353 [Aspergillus egyptiacus]